MGGLLTAATNYSSAATAATSGTFVVFGSLMVLGTLLALALICPPGAVCQPDGSLAAAVCTSAPEHCCDEASAAAGLLYRREALLLTPLFIYTGPTNLSTPPPHDIAAATAACPHNVTGRHGSRPGWFYPYQFEVFNAGFFNARSQGINNAFYWGAQVRSRPQPAALVVVVVVVAAVAVAVVVAHRTQLHCTARPAALLLMLGAGRLACSDGRGWLDRTATGCGWAVSFGQGEEHAASARGRHLDLLARGGLLCSKARGAGRAHVADCRQPARAAAD